MTTKFQVRHVFPFPPETFWTRVHANTEFNRALYNEHLGHRYDILVNDEASGKWLSRMYPKVDLPPVLAKAAAGKEDGFYLEEEDVLDRSTMTYRFKVRPSTMGDKVDVDGDMVLLPHGEGGSERVVNFEIEVRAFGLGKIIESFVEMTVRRGYDDSGAFLQKYLAEGI